jgi:hypothetical protein
VSSSKHRGLCSPFPACAECPHWTRPMCLATLLVLMTTWVEWQSTSRSHCRSKPPHLWSLCNGPKNTQMQRDLTPTIELWVFGSPVGLQLRTFGSVGFTFTLSTKWGCDRSGNKIKKRIVKHKRMDERYELKQLPIYNHNSWNINFTKNSVESICNVYLQHHQIKGQNLKLSEYCAPSFHNFP